MSKSTEFDAVVRRLFGGDERVDADDRHLHRPGAQRDREPDLAEADDAEGPAAQLQPGELGPLPLAATDRGVRRSDPPRHRVQERQRVLRGRDRVAGRCIDDGDPGLRGGLEVHVVHADPGPADDDELRAGRDQRGVGLDLAAHDERVVVADDRGQFSRTQPVAFVDVVMGPEQLHALLCDGFGDEDPHAVTRAVRPSDSRPATWAAATADPGTTGRPAAIEAISRVLIAPRISSSVTEPR